MLHVVTWPKYRILYTSKITFGNRLALVTLVLVGKCSHCVVFMKLFSDKSQIGAMKRNNKEVNYKINHDYCKLTSENGNRDPTACRLLLHRNTLMCGFMKCIP